MPVAPADIMAANVALKRRADRPKSYIFAGISGDARHSFGYHVDPNHLPHSDYSVVLAADKAGAHAHPTWASAWDLTFHESDMELVTNRLLAAAKSHDPRMKAVREFCGTRDGRNTYPWDCHSNSSEGLNSWDDSHLWHVHISFYRNASAKDIMAVVDVICGKKKTITQVIKGGTTSITKGLKKPKFPLPAGQYYGPKSGPNASHGGYYTSERAVIRKIQLQLVAEGCVPHVGHLKASAWSDGIWEAPTSAAMRTWQTKHKLPRTGRCTATDWKVMF